MKNELKRILVITMSIITLASSNVTYADKLSDAKEAKQEAEKQLSDLDEKLEDIEKKQEELQEEIDGLDAELVALLYDIALIEEEIENNKKEIAITQKELEAAKADEKKQYEAMKIRIKYMYENGNDSLGSALIIGNDYSAPLNKTTMFENIYNYDRELLKKYEKAKQKVEDIMDVLDEEKDMLEEKETSLKEQQSELEKKIEERKKLSDDYDSELEDAKELAEKYKETIDEQNKIIEEQLAKLYSTKNVGAYDTSYVAPGDGKGSDIANYALNFLGNPYVYGGTSLTKGIDCSAFVQAVYSHFGYSLPRTSYSQRFVGRSVSASELQPGDLVCYSGHVAIYIGNGKIVHASNRKSGIKISNSINYRNIISFRRIIED